MALVRMRNISLEFVSNKMSAKRRMVHAKLVRALEILGEDARLPDGYGKPVTRRRGI